MLLDTLSWRVLLIRLQTRVSYLRLLSARIGAEAVLLGISGGAVLADAAAPYFLKRRWEVPLSGTMAAAALRKCALLMAQSLYLGLGALVGFGFLKQVSPQLTGTGLLPAAVAVLAVLLLGLGILGGVLLTGGGALPRLQSLAARLDRRFSWFSLNAFHGGLGSADRRLSDFGRGRVRRWLVPVGLYLLVWLAESVETYLILRVLGVDIAFSAVLAMEPVVVMLRYLVFFIPGGVGIQEIGYLAFFKAMGIPAPVETALAFSLLKRLRELLWIVLGYAVILSGESRPLLRSVPERS